MHSPGINLIMTVGFPPENLTKEESEVEKSEERRARGN
jgi:hypothetical protein